MPRLCNLVARSHGAEIATKSPKEDIRSAPIRHVSAWYKRIARNMNTNRVHGHMLKPVGLKVLWDHLRHTPSFPFRLTLCRRQHQLEKRVWKKRQRGGLTLPAVLWRERRNSGRQEGWYNQVSRRGLISVSFNDIDETEKYTVYLTFER